MQPLLLDTGFLYALLNRNDQHHAKVLQVAQTLIEPVLLPTVVTTEVAYLVRRYMGSAGLAHFLELLADDAYMLIEPTTADFKRAAAIVHHYNDANIDFVDVVLVAIAERLNITRILTIDQRHFRLFRPAHCIAFELLP